MDPREAAAGKAAIAKLLTYPAEQAAADILEAVEHRRVPAGHHPAGPGLDVLARLLPVAHTRLLARIFRGPRRR